MSRALIFLSLFITSLWAQTSSTQTSIESALLGGTLTDRATKNRLGVLCNKYVDVTLGNITTKQCAQFYIIEFNGKNEVQNYTFLKSVSTSEQIKEFSNKIDTEYDSSIYSDLSIYYNHSPYFYGLTAVNAYGCKNDSWAWCLLLPITATIDTVATAGYNVGASVWEGGVAAANLVDNIGSRSSLNREQKRVLKNLVYLLNTKKKGKNKTISKKKYNLIYATIVY
jgi:hypothetical protein